MESSLMADLQRFLRDRCLSVLNLPGKGRSLFTSRDFRPGEVILSQETYVCVPNNDESRCDGCFKTNNLKKCSGCQVVWYCGSSCQKSEWKLHRHECRALSRLEKEKRMLVTPTIRLMLKLYLKRNLQNEKVMPITTTDNYSLVEALVSHMSELDEKQLMLYAQMANLVNLILQLPSIDLKEITENFSKFSCNAHSICDSELRPQGIGLFPLVSIINHSCSPNAILVFEDQMAVVRAMEKENIPKDSEVTISYIETAGSTLTRQKSLKEQYIFHCECARCSNIGKPHDIEESAILEGYRCANETCTGFLLRDPDEKGFVCQKCMLLRSKEEVKKLAGDVKTVSEKAPASPSAENKQDAIALYKAMEKLQIRLYHSFSISLMRTREKLLKMLMEVESWTEALNYCRLIVPVYQRVYPATHSLIGLQFYTQGKLEWLLGQTEEAVSSLIKASDILRISHGTSTHFMKELSEKLDEARAEASYKLLALEDAYNDDN